MWNVFIDNRNSYNLLDMIGIKPCFQALYRGPLTLNAWEAFCTHSKELGDKTRLVLEGILYSVNYATVLFWPRPFLDLSMVSQKGKLQNVFRHMHARNCNSCVQLGFLHLQVFVYM